MANDLMMEEFRRRKEEVEDILARYPEARNNDFYLQWLWLRRHLPDLPYIPWEEIKQFAGALETVRRMRQKIQNDEQRLLPTDLEVLARRRAKSKKFTETINDI